MSETKSAKINHVESETSVDGPAESTTSASTNRPSTPGSSQASTKDLESDDGLGTTGEGSASEHTPEPIESFERGSPAQLDPQRVGSKDGRHFVISWHKLDYVLEPKWHSLVGQRKNILNSLSGQFRSGELSAVLGPSGAGKSTLLDCLLGKHKRGLSGQTRVEFRDSDYGLTRRAKRPLRIALIPQEDHLLDTLTVYETFMFASKIKNAHLRYEEEEDEEEDDLDGARRAQEEARRSAHGRPANDSRRRRPFDHAANVQRVIQRLNLGSCAKTRCGKLSGGQYKRVSIGQELLSRPDVMILDEPTSGLDSVTCFQTVEALRELIRSSPYPMAIVSTIHQPDIEVFNLFHRVYVLAEGGRAIYEGPTSAIFDTIRLGAATVEARRNQLERRFVSSMNNHNDLDCLREQLKNTDHCNPARVIVQIAAQECGFELTSTLNEIQAAAHEQWELARSLGGESMSASSSLEVVTHDSSSSSSSSSRMSHNQKHQSVPGGLDMKGSSLASVRFQPENCDPGPNRRSAQLDTLLSLVDANTKRRRSLMVHMKHYAYHTSRSWKTITRDPMLCIIQIILHILVPCLIAYTFQGVSGEACPQVGQADLIELAYAPSDPMAELNASVRKEVGNAGYFFFQLYVIMFAAVCAVSLTYPMDMHIILKEYRNGWYSMLSYFLGRTTADLPLPSINAVLAFAVSYHLTGQPLSPYAWRFLSIATLTVLCSLVSQTMGLMFGALLMNAPQSAVFVAPTSTAPLVVVAGFLVRMKSLPEPLKILSNFSQFTYVFRGALISRYGFNRCPCDDSDFQPIPEHQIPSQARAMLDYWADSFRADYAPVNATNQANLVDRLVNTLERANTFGFEITDCAQVKPFTMLEYELYDSDLALCFVALILMLVVWRCITYAVLSWKISSCL